MIRVLIVAGITTFLFVMTTFGDELDKPSQEALQKTQQLLQDPSARDQAIKGDSKALQADQNLKNVMGSPELTEQAYKLSADIFKDEATKNGGDVKRMTDSITDAGSNPEAWEKQLKPEQIRQIQEMARQIEASQQQMVQPHQ